MVMFGRCWANQKQADQANVLEESKAGKTYSGGGEFRVFLVVVVVTSPAKEWCLFSSFDVLAREDGL